MGGGGGGEGGGVHIYICVRISAWIVHGSNSVISSLYTLDYLSSKGSHGASTSLS